MKLKSIISVILVVIIAALCFAGCGAKSGGNNYTAAGEYTVGAKSGTPYKIGICNYVDDASLNQIAQSIGEQLDKVGNEKSMAITVSYENCNGDSNVLNQIIANFVANGVDLMVGIATPVAMAMQTATEENKIPVIFSAVSDPVGCKLVNSLAAPGGNISGTSDYLDTNAIFNLMFAAQPDISAVGLLYDAGQDSSTLPIASAKKLLAEKGVKVIEKTGTNVSEITLAAQALTDAGVKAVFTPTDNTVMTAELSIYEMLANAGVAHYAGADSFALNGAFLGYGVDYANLGRETANMITDVLGGADIAKMPVKTFDNGTATVNTDICSKLGMNYNDLQQKFAPYCTKVQQITTAEDFN